MLGLICREENIWQSESKKYKGGDVVKIYIGNDHGGYYLKKQLMNYLKSKKHKVLNEGSDTTDIVRYPYFAARVARSVSIGEGDLGILICNSGIGMSIAANKFRGVRAAVVSDTESAMMTKKHNNSNILCLPGKNLDFETAREMVDTWIETDFEGGRHCISLDLIEQIEDDNEIKSNFNIYDKEASDRTPDFYKNHQKPNIILDTDMLTDCDDVAALTMLFNLEKQGVADVKAITVSSANELSAPTVNVVTEYMGRGDIPIGVPEKGQGGVRNDSCFLKPLTDEFPHTLKSGYDAPLGYKVMRKTLSDADDNSVKIVTIGYMTNLAALLKSPADEISELTGAELIDKKVNEWVCMGGNFPDDPAYDNVNFTRDLDNALYCLRHYKGRITFVGREIGHNIFVGNEFKTLKMPNPLYRSYELHRGRWGDDWDHHTADPSTILYAVFGIADRFEVQTGTMSINDDGSFAWDPEKQSNMAYLLQKQERGKTKKDIADIIMGY